MCRRQSQQNTPSAQSSAHTLTVSLRFSVRWKSHTPVHFFFFQNCIFLDSCTYSNRVMYLLFTAGCKIQISFSLNVKVQRSCSSALNAMLTTTTRWTSGNASNCWEESAISDRRAQPGGYYFTCFTVVTGRKSLCCSCHCMWLQLYKSSSMHVYLSWKNSHKLSAGAQMVLSPFLMGTNMRVPTSVCNYSVFFLLFYLLSYLFSYILFDFYLNTAAVLRKFLWK